VNISYRFIEVCLKAISSLICRIDAVEAERVPPHGPLIIFTNHVNVLEIPILFTRLQPRKMHGMILAERWDIPVLRWMLEVTETIPLHRGEADIDAFHRGLEVLKRGEILVISPEGTRSHDGRLQQAHPGVVLLALRSQAPLLPVAYYGAESWQENLSHLKRTDFHLKVGRPFQLQTSGEKVKHAARQRMIDAMMVQLALLLPEKYRGYYADASLARDRYLVFG
jgi:1-acyl-sn-glycerol-3-phosphate acyltransferase